MIVLHSPIQIKILPQPHAAFQHNTPQNNDQRFE